MNNIYVTLRVAHTGKKSDAEIAQLISGRAWTLDTVEGAELLGVSAVQRCKPATTQAARLDNVVLRLRVNLLAYTVKDRLGVHRAKEIIARYSPTHTLGGVSDDRLIAFKIDLDSALLMHEIAREEERKADMSPATGGDGEPDDLIPLAKPRRAFWNLRTGITPFLDDGVAGD